jgi:hypothetical protein
VIPFYRLLEVAVTSTSTWKTLIFRKPRKRSDEPREDSPLEYALFW